MSLKKNKGNLTVNLLRASLKKQFTILFAYQTNEQVNNCPDLENYDIFKVKYLFAFWFSKFVRAICTLNSIVTKR